MSPTQTKSEAREWTCGRCEMTSRWAAGHECGDCPPNWAKEKGIYYCLACRRERAAEAKLAEVPASRAADRAKLRLTAIIEFEIERDPDRTNGEIAKAARCSPLAVVKARQRLAAGKLV